MTTLADELKEVALNNAIRLREERELAALNREKAEQDRINLVLQKTYDYFESNWLKKAKESALKGYKSFSVELKERGRNESDRDYDKTEDCYSITGVFLYQLFKIIDNKGVGYFDSLCKQIEDQGFKNVKVTCGSYSWVTFSCDHMVSYNIHLSADF